MDADKRRILASLMQLHRLFTWARKEPSSDVAILSLGSRRYMPSIANEAPIMPQLA